MSGRSGLVDIQDVSSDCEDGQQETGLNKDGSGNEVAMENSKDKIPELGNKEIAKSEKDEEITVQGASLAAEVISAQAKLIKATKLDLPPGFCDVQGLSSDSNSPASGKQMSDFFCSLQREGQIALLIGTAIVLCVFATSAGSDVFILTTGVCVFSYFGFKYLQRAFEVHVKANVKESVTATAKAMQETQGAVGTIVNEAGVAFGKHYLDTFTAVLKIKSEVQMEQIKATKDMDMLRTKTDNEIKAILEKERSNRQRGKNQTVSKIEEIRGKMISEVVWRQTEVEKMKEETKARIEKLRETTKMSKDHLDADVKVKETEIEANRFKHTIYCQTEAEMRRDAAEAQNKKDLIREQTTRVKMRIEADEKVETDRSKQLSAAEVQKNQERLRQETEQKRLRLEAEVQQAKLAAVSEQKQREAENRRVAADVEKNRELQRQETDRIRIRHETELAAELAKADASIKIEKEATAQVQIMEDNSCVIM